MVEGARSRRLARRAECHRILCNNPEYREAENEQQCNRRSDPEYREAESKQQCNRRSDPEYRACKQVADMERHVVARLDPEYREQENEQQRNRRSDPEYLARENEQQCNRRTSTTYRTTYDMACTYKDGEFSFGQPCGKWNVPCVHGCGYFHPLDPSYTIPRLTREQRCEWLHRQKDLLHELQHPESYQGPPNWDP